jgi:hypothetical protein
MSNNPLRVAYCDFMSEYLSLGHMSVAKIPGRYIIPHHAMFNQSNGDLKIRVLAAISEEDCAGHESIRQALLQQTYVDVNLRYMCIDADTTNDVE